MPFRLVMVPHREFVCVGSYVCAKCQDTYFLELLEYQEAMS